MKIICFSDLHLEFEEPFTPPSEDIADVMILAGDIITFSDFTPFEQIVQAWQKPILFITGNHEFYTRRPMQEGIDAFKRWAQDYPHLTFLEDEAITINGIHFFGGTMWTDFDGGKVYSMRTAQKKMNDYRMIKTGEGKRDFITPQQTITFHERYKERLIDWFEQDLSGPRVVISHHMPVQSHNPIHRESHMQPAYGSLDMEKVIKDYQPQLWIYGHTHEPDDRMFGDTRVVSNPRGYPLRTGAFECKGYDDQGMIIEV